MFHVKRFGFSFFLNVPRETYLRKIKEFYNVPRGTL